VPDKVVKLRPDQVNLPCLADVSHLPCFSGTVRCLCIAFTSVSNKLPGTNQDPCTQIHLYTSTGCSEVLQMGLFCFWPSSWRCDFFGILYRGLQWPPVRMEALMKDRLMLNERLSSHSTASSSRPTACSGVRGGIWRQAAVAQAGLRPWTQRSGSGYRQGMLQVCQWHMAEAGRASLSLIFLSSVAHACPGSRLLGSCPV
jgi:hypothetical protein